jgi:hypothetical protein
MLHRYVLYQVEYRNGWGEAVWLRGYDAADRWFAARLHLIAWAMEVTTC